MHSIDKAGDLVVKEGGRIAIASLLRVPGRDGHGAYMGEFHVPGACTDEMPLRENIADAICDLAGALERHGFAVPAISLPAKLIYGGAWAPGALETQVEYDPLEDPRAGEACRRFFNLLWVNLPGKWLLSSAIRPKGLEVVCLSPNGLTTAVYDMGVLASAADSDYIDKLALAASRMFIYPQET